MRAAIGCLLMACLGQATTSYLINLQANNGQYFCAQGGGGGSGDLVADRNSVGLWETFILDDLNDGSLQAGDPVALRARATGLYLCAYSGGGGDVVVNRIYVGGWETLTIGKSGGGTISSGNQIHLQVNNGQYLRALGGGGGQVYATGSSVGSYETFTITLSAAPSTLWSTPAYAPTYWNDASTIQFNNNCYNYAVNRRTDTFAQPGRAAGAMYGSLTTTALYNAAMADGLEPTSYGATPPEGKSKIAIAVWTGVDYHLFRLDSGGNWSHKPGSTSATNLDNSGNPITNPETADRGPYTAFAGFFLVPSDSSQGQGLANIN